MKCPSFELMFAFARTQLPPNEAEAIRTHINEGCAKCGRRLTDLETFLSATEEWELIDPPEWLLHQATVLFESHLGTRSGQKKRVWGLLVTDTWGEEFLVGFRQSRRLTRQLLYRAGSFDVDLTIQHNDRTNTMEIVGQANPLGGDMNVVAEAKVELWSGDGGTALTRTNQFGVFFLDGIPEGTYELTIELRNEEIRIPGVEARQQA